MLCSGGWGHIQRYALAQVTVYVRWLSGTNLYPIPRTVNRYSGFDGSSSIYRRSRTTKLSIARVSVSSCKPQTSSKIDLRDTTLPILRTRWRNNPASIHLTEMEAGLLRHLVRNIGRVVSRKSILEEVWGLHEDTDTRAIDNFVARLRRYIEDDPSKP